MKRPGAPNGNKNALKDGRDTNFHVRASSALKAAAKAAAGTGGMSDFIAEAIREHIKRTRPDVAERFPEAFKDRSSAR